jgi:putative membrane protein
MKLQNRFSENDLATIKAAVKNAEDKISGEIVPVIVERSAGYATAHYRSCLCFGLLGFFTIIILDRYIIFDSSSTLYYDPMFIFFVVLTCSVFGYFLPGFSPGIKRIFIRQSQLNECTRQRAENAFLEEEVFNTRHRTGIMIFVSFFEHEVIIMADRGISKVVEQREWDSMVAELINNIRQDKVIEGIESGVKRCGEILLEKGFVKTADDVNELGDDLRFN